MNIKIYLLQTGEETIRVVDNRELLLETLKQIAASKECELYALIGYDRNCSPYEMVDKKGHNIRYCITEQTLELSESTMGAVSREMDVLNKKQDVENFITGMYEGGNLPAWKFYYISEDWDRITDEILVVFDKYESCNRSFNATMENSIDAVLRKINLNDEVIEIVWGLLVDSFHFDEEGYLQHEYLDFEVGVTSRDEVYEWFDKHYSKGINALREEDN